VASLPIIALVLKPPDLDEALLSCAIAVDFGLNVEALTFLPVGNDADTAAYRLRTVTGTTFFVKLRRTSSFQPASVRLPRLLSAAGITQVISPFETLSGEMFSSFEMFKLALYPFVVGANAFERPLTSDQWIGLGRAVRSLHKLHLGAAIRAEMSLETFSAPHRDRVREHMANESTASLDDSVSRGLADLLRANSASISRLLEVAEERAGALPELGLAFVPCHGDLHAGNVLVAEDGAFFLVDWDTLILAPRERDLMFIGAGIGGAWNQPHEGTLFYEGYGKAAVSEAALEYYRAERVIEDIASYCDEILEWKVSAADRARGLSKLAAAFDPGDVVDIALRPGETSRSFGR
jgi:spectinomycin phosphotransferase